MYSDQRYDCFQALTGTSLVNRSSKNIIPQRDVVPMIDDVAQNWQGIRCQAGFVDVVGCHNSIRSLCEIMYSCGTGNRPFLCACVTEFNYPEPVLKAGANSSVSFKELCGITEE
jgi:hypothetical protein